MSNRKQDTIDQINRLWGLHEPEDERLKTEGRCLAFVIDRRYVEREGAEMRLGVSFGHAVVGPETDQGFLPIPVKPGKFVFGLHEIGTKGNQLTIYDSWLNAFEAGGCTDAVEAETKARSILESRSDEEYAALVRESKDDKRPLQVSERCLLEDFEVVEANAF